MDTYQIDVEPRVLFQVLGWQPSHTFAGDIAAYYADYCRLGKDLAREFFGPERMENGGWSLLSIYICFYVQGDLLLCSVNIYIHNYIFIFIFNMHRIGFNYAYIHCIKISYMYMYMHI